MVPHLQEHGAARQPCSGTPGAPRGSTSRASRTQGGVTHASGSLNALPKGRPARGTPAARHPLEALRRTAPLHGLRCAAHAVRAAAGQAEAEAAYESTGHSVSPWKDRQRQGDELNLNQARQGHPRQQVPLSTSLSAAALHVSPTMTSPDITVVDSFMRQARPPACP